MLALPAQLAALLLLLAPVADGWLGVYLAADQKEAVIAEVLPGSPASKAGLQAGDVLLAVGDQATANATEFIAAIRGLAAGDRVRLRIRRGEKEMIVLVKLGERPENPAAAPQPSPTGKGQPPQPGGEAGPKAPAAADQEPAGYLGIRVREAEGVVVDGVLDGSPAMAAGIKAGELLQSVGDQPVRNLADLDRALANRNSGSKLVLGLRGPDGVRSLTVVLGTRPGPFRRESGAARQAPAAKPAPEAKPASTPEALEQELEALRAELERLRKQVEELRKGTGRE